MPRTKPANIPEHILVVDDDSTVRELLHELLTRKGHQVELAHDATMALYMLQQKDYALVLVDIKMPGLDGISLLREMRRAQIASEVIILTGFGTVESAVEAMKLGAYDYLTKPFESAMLYLMVTKALQKAGVERQNVHLRVALQQSIPRVELVGDSLPMQQLRKLITQVAEVDATAIIQGETGTGKELVARLIHEQGPRHGEPFLALNCASIPEPLLASELFGHEKQAFTGATGMKIGIFEAADRGTLFLDELSEMPPPMQADVLRTVESGEFRRIGSNHVGYTNARILAATNKDLQMEVEAGRFRRDLFYRLNVVILELPPLRHRQGDTTLLAHHFLADSVNRLRKSVRGFTQEALDVLENYSWPGNVRELRNVIERAVLLCDTERISAAGLYLSQHNQCRRSDYQETWTLEQLECYHIQRAFVRNNKYRDATASELGISVRTLYRKLRKFNLLEEV